ncbi:MAG TPA: BREX-1 system phosphatase PglZ type B [Chitinispirillaceae bacterium]|nr:BREX-1 system phosphatase PglZ type B [Chitinispirillaceae bacterium]
MKTLLDCIVSHIRKSADYNPNARVAPACILWTDEKSEWLNVIDIFKNVMPELFVLGKYNPEERTGPAMWLKCVLDKSGTESNVQVIYLPGVSYNTLRDTVNCPVELQPLVELIYRGVCYRHPNNRDWSVRAFLSSSESLNLTVNSDVSTDEALKRVLPELLQCDVTELAEKTIDASFLDLILQPDIPKSILQWMNSPSEWQKQCTKAAWQSFKEICERDYGFNPEKDGPSRATESLAGSNGKWEQVWDRFVETPFQYNGVVGRLERCTFKDGVVSHFPSENSRLEKELEAELETALACNEKESVEWILKLQKKHSERKDWVWYRLDKSPQLDLLNAIAELAGAITATGNPSQNMDELKSWYTECGYIVDKAALRLGMMPLQLTNAANAWIRHLYKPWLEKCAEMLSAAVREKGYKADLFKKDDIDSCILFFIDGLRYDTGSILLEKLLEAGFDANISHRWAPLPTVTATGKAYIAPVGDLKGSADDARDNFKPRLITGQIFNENTLKTVINKNGWQYLRLPEFGNFAGKAWTSCGDLDALGHTIGWKFVKSLEAQLEEIVQYIEQLIAMGWKNVRIITDHGWLTMPGGLPYTTLASGLTYDKSLRCALLKDGVTIDFLHLPWSIADDVTVAYAPGISAFASAEYAHGGLSLQECIVPSIDVLGIKLKSKDIKFEKIDWKGMRCRVTLSVSRPEFAIDIRLNALDKASSVLSTAKKLKDGENTISVAVDVDESEGKNGFIVLLDEKENVVIDAATIIGGVQI